MVQGQQRQLHGLSTDHQPVVGHCVKRHAMRRQDRIGVVAFLDPETEIDLITSQVAQTH